MYKIKLVAEWESLTGCSGQRVEISGTSIDYSQLIDMFISFSKAMGFQDDTIQDYIQSA